MVRRVPRVRADGQPLQRRRDDHGRGQPRGRATPAIQYVGVFYNKEKLADLGVTDVSTIDSKDAFLALLDQAKAAGELPVMLGDSDRWPALHNLSLLNGWYVTPQAINDWVFNKEGATYNDAGHIQGAQDFQDWMANGYFNADALATSFNDAVARFGTGRGRVLHRRHVGARRHLPVHGRQRRVHALPGGTQRHACRRRRLQPAVHHLVQEPRTRTAPLRSSIS